MRKATYERIYNDAHDWFDLNYSHIAWLKPDAAELVERITETLFYSVGNRCKWETIEKVVKDVVNERLAEN